MTVLFQVAGKARPKRAEALKDAFARAAAPLRTRPGFVNARLLVSYATLQVQLLFYWETFEQGAAFHAQGYPRFSAALAELLEPRGTLITSIVESELARAA